MGSALEKRNEQMEKVEGRAEEKKLNRVDRYRCANAGCGVQADTRRMLSQCKDKYYSFCGF
jgi:hypothetical protein